MKVVMILYPMNNFTPIKWQRKNICIEVKRLQFHMKVVMILWPLHIDQMKHIFIEVKQKWKFSHESGDDLVSLAHWANETYL